MRRHRVISSLLKSPVLGCQQPTRTQVDEAGLRAVQGLS